MWGDAIVAINIPSDRPVHVYIHTGQATPGVTGCEANADATAYTSNGGGRRLLWWWWWWSDLALGKCQLELSIPFVFFLVSVNCVANES